MTKIMMAFYERNKEENVEAVSSIIFTHWDNFIATVKTKEATIIL